MDNSTSTMDSPKRIIMKYGHENRPPPSHDELSYQKCVRSNNESCDTINGLIMSHSLPAALYVLFRKGSAKLLGADFNGAPAFLTKQCQEMQSAYVVHRSD